MSNGNSVMEFTKKDIYELCLKEAERGSMRRGIGEGAVLYVFFKHNGVVQFRNRSRHRRDFLKDYGLSCSGFQEHAEQAVVNDALKYARDEDDVIMGAALFIAGYFDGKPYRYKERTYICMNCASYIKEVLPLYSTFIYLPAEKGWYCFSVYELFKVAVEAYMIYGKTSEVRKASLEV